MSDNLPAIRGHLVEPTSLKSARAKELAKDYGIRPQPKRWQPPTDPKAQAWALRELLRTGRHQLVLSCERTRQVDPDKPNSPVVVCAPDNCNIPCFNCVVAILIGKKRWVI